MVKYGIILSCYEKTDDLLAHLDILKYNKHTPKIIVIYMHPDEINEDVGAEVVKIPSPGFVSGPLLSLCIGLRKANKYGLDYVVYRNADDWFFNHDLCHDWVSFMVENGKKCAGYNWFSVGGYKDITMNENILHVPTFMETVEKAEKYFVSSDQTYNCEYKMATWVRFTLKNLEEEFFRLPDREQSPGIGWEIQDIPGIYKQQGLEMPDIMWKKFEENQRFFNKKWQMIGSHNNYARFLFWHQIRGSVPYAVSLEEEKHFSRFIHAVKYSLPWNKPEKNVSRLSRRTRVKPIRTQKNIKLKFFSQ